jgi:cytochrome c
MKNLETNKIVASVLLAVLIALLCGKAADVLYRPETHLVERGYEVAVEGKEGGVAKDEGPKASFEELLAQGTPEAGKKVFEKCAACHDATQGAAHRVGPNLYGVLGKKKAAAEGFAYSDAMKGKGGEWSIADLHEFLKNPRAYVPGTKMSFKGLSKDKDVADVILYLRGMGSPDVPLPAAPAAPAQPPAEQKK